MSVREGEREGKRSNEGSVHFLAPCSLSLLELVLLPDPDELDSSSLSSELLLLLALSREE